MLLLSLRSIHHNSTILFKALQRFRYSKNPEDKKFANSLFMILGFYPKNISLYYQAFRHGSSDTIKKGITESNERLEYLGDAILGSVVAEYLFKIYPFKDEGFLTQMRSKIVNRAKLNKLSVKLGLNDMISSKIKTAVGSSMNGDAFEALIGAAYLDRGYVQTKIFVVQRILKIHFDLDELEQTDEDYKSRLIQWSQKEKKNLLFNLINETGQGRSKEFVVQIEVDGEAVCVINHVSKRRAEQICAMMVIEKLKLPT